MDNIIIQVARGRVNQYAEESIDLMRHHAEEMECRDCEDHLQRGIDAFKWIQRGEEMLRELDAQGISPFTAETKEALDSLYSAWLKPCAQAEEWIQDLGLRGYSPDNLSRFREICEEVEEIAEHRDWQKKADRVRVANSSQEDW